MKISAKTGFGLLGLIVGFGLGYLCSNISFGEGNAAGNISKVSKYSKSVVTPQASAYQEKVMNDADEYARAKASIALLSTRMQDFDKLVGIAVKTGDGVEELAPIVDRLQKMSLLSENAKNVAEQAVASFNEMLDGGKEAAATFETASQNLVLTYLLVDRQVNIGKEYVSCVDDYLQGKKLADHKGLAVSRDLWAGYCAGEAVLNGDNKELAYWNKKNSIASDYILSAVENPSLTTLGLEVSDLTNVLNAYQGPGSALNLDVTAGSLFANIGVNPQVYGLLPQPPAMNAVQSATSAEN